MSADPDGSSDGDTDPADADSEAARERAARLESERVSRLKDEFLSTIGYELRAPLNAILGWSRLLESGRLSPEETQRGGRTVARNARALAQLVDDLLDMSSMLTGKVRVEAEETDLREIVQAAIETIQGAADVKGVELRTLLDDSACLVFGDPQRLQRVIWNLLSNAVKFTPRGGQIAVSLSCRGTDCRVEIVDTGVGMAPEFLPSVFDRFRHADAANRPPGLGLGLAIAKQLIELHGGEIQATSAGEGHGATFTVTLPRVGPTESLSPSESEANGTLARTAAPMDLGSLRVLIVDDEPDALDLSKRVLGECRAQVATAMSVEAALATLHAFHPNVLVSDLNMPGRDGYELIRTVRATMSADELPAVALTGFVRPEDETRAKAAGFQLHLAKPIEPEELLRAVARLARRTDAAAPAAT